MSILFNEATQTFHLFNKEISYLMTVLPNGHLGQLYFGRAVRDREDFDYLLEMRSRPMSACRFASTRRIWVTFSTWLLPRRGTGSRLAMLPENSRT